MSSVLPKKLNEAVHAPKDSCAIATICSPLDVIDSPTSFESPLEAYEKFKLKLLSLGDNLR